MTIATETLHICRDENGVPVIDGTGVKVVEVVLTKQANDLSAEEVQNFLPHLSLAQIYASLSFFYDHQDELAEDLEQRRQFAQQQAEHSGQPSRAQWIEKARQRGVSPEVLQRFAA